jgi:hypothetical protein
MSVMCKNGKFSFHSILKYGMTKIVNLMYLLDKQTNYLMLLIGVTQLGL